MKKGRKLLLTAVMAMLFTLFLGINAFAAGNEAIVPPLKDYKGDLSAGAMDYVSANPQDYTTEKGAICVPIRVSGPGKVYIGIRFKDADLEVKKGVAALISTSDDLKDQSAWMTSAFTMIYGGAGDEGLGAVHFSVEKADTFYLHIFSEELVDTPTTIQAAGFEVGISVKGSKIKLSKTSVTWNGKEQKPVVTVKDDSGKSISKSSYTVKYSNNKNAGEATVTVTFKNGYTGTVKKTFTIVPKGTALSKVTGAKKGFSVKWKKQASQTTGYEIQYAVKSNFKGAKTVSNIGSKVTSKKIAKLKAKQKYYVRIRTYKTAKVGGKSKKLYSAWSKAKTVVTKK